MVSVIRFDLDMDRDEIGAFSGDGDMKLRNLAEFFDKFADMLMVQRVILDWSECSWKRYLLPYFITFLFGAVSDSCKISFLTPSNFCKWS